MTAGSVPAGRQQTVVLRVSLVRTIFPVSVSQRTVRPTETAMTTSTNFAMLVALAAAASLNADPLDTTFKVNGSTIALKHAAWPRRATTRRRRSRFYQVILSEKAPATASRPWKKALDGELGAYVLATFDTELGHRADEFSVGGVKIAGDGDMLHADDMKLEGGKLSGRLHTGGVAKTSDGTAIELDAAFSVAVPAS